MSRIFSTFWAYQTPTPQDYGDVMRNGMVVLDANVFLGLYRYNDKTRQEMLGVLKKLASALWIPHQVVREFWGARLSALGARERRAKQLCKEIGEYFQKASNLLRGWAPTVSLEEGQLHEMLAHIEECSEQLERGVTRVSGFDSDRSSWVDTNKDPVVVELHHILDGHVGAPLSPDEDEDAREEASRRAASEIPPGYRDAKKAAQKGAESGDAAGDYLVWEQTLKEAESRGCDVLFVTADVKDDWWRRSKDQVLGPREELVEEMRARTGKRLFMLQPAVFLQMANESFDLDLDPETVASIERADRTDGGVGWTKEALHTLLRTLDENAPVRAKVIRHALQQGGYVSREEVYELGEYRDTRKLSGWTRPIRTWTNALRDAGEIDVDEGAIDVLEVLYDGPFGRATGFRIPEQLVELLAEDGET